MPELEAAVRAGAVGLYFPLLAPPPDSSGRKLEYLSDVI